MMRKLYQEMVLKQQLDTKEADKPVQIQGLSERRPSLWKLRWWRSKTLTKSRFHARRKGAKTQENAVDAKLKAVVSFPGLLRVCVKPTFVTVKFRVPHKSVAMLKDLRSASSPKVSSILGRGVSVCAVNAMRT